MKRKIMAVGAHADDIEFNAGGTLAKYRAAGYEIVYVMSTNNMSGSWSTLDSQGRRQSRMPPHHEIMPQRKKEAALAAAYFGTEAVHLDHPQRHYTREDGKVEDVRFGSACPKGLASNTPTILTAYENADCVGRLRDLILQHEPEAILSHGMTTGNIEHVGSCLLVSNAHFKASAAGHAGMLLYWQDIHTAPSGEAYRKWDTFVDISQYWTQKLEALALHACQIVDLSTLVFPDHGPACNCRHAEVFLMADRGEALAAGGAFAQEIIGHLR